MNKSISSLSKKKWTTDDMPDQSGKVFIVTGANSGLGKEASLRLAEKNAEVIMACRNLEKGQKAFDEIKEIVPDTKLVLFQLNLASLKSVKEFARNVIERYDRLDGLMNNAGIMQPPYMKTEEGMELQIGVNHMAHFKLTALLYDLLKKTPGSRVVNQSSIAHKMGRMNFDDINSEKSYSRNAAYGQSKLANLLFTYELARRAGDDLQAIAVHPGYTDTPLQQNGPAVGGKSYLSRIYSLSDKLLGMPVWKGTLPMLYALTMDDVQSGDYIGPNKFGGARGWPQRIKSNKRSYNEEDSKKLWEISEKMTNTSFLSN
ncbi:MAG: SDR family NAD(P)-dependent oxidoreductase [Candidatus Heimdallarchaeota archaeon]|nr:SDR family NAD(P)-dependent oxidoreductase [Candidatus Heimdallarchaeota archaeon]